ncbi:hypothetical protein POM88_039508 [Heracleum sosnowskyi]|uniref:Uncharacterized protein n=1 Tax=Heracleum sosnowskyi TaxID=360622 RepID=A0AAD8M8V9_9APIA|nr:hypothetical protein POM88_039508 [Heracleum sosnowskyi]
MVLDSKITSPHRRQNSFNSPSLKKPYTRGDELGSFSTLLNRHRFLLVALVLLTFLCTVYLYFAVTFGSDDLCSSLSGAQKSLCHIKQAKESISKGKLKFF